MSPSSNVSSSLASAPTTRASRQRRCCARGEALDAALAAPGAATAVRVPVDDAGALAWRDYMVSDYDDAGQVKWLADGGIDLIRGNGRIAEPGVVEVDGAASARLTS